MKTQFFHNFGTSLVEGPEYDNFVATYLIEEKHIEPNNGYLKLDFTEEGKLAKASIRFNGKMQALSRFKYLNIDAAIGKLPYKNYAPNIPLTIHPNANGISYLGGNPNNFIVPSPAEFSKFQYFGFISKEETCFPDLEFDIHLTFPLFCNADDLYLDYSKVNEPQIFNKDNFFTEEVFDGMDSSFEIEYSKIPISFEPLKGHLYGQDSVGRAGIYACSFAGAYNRPLSPITKKPMNFLCQIDGGSDVPVKYKSVSKGSSLYEYDFKQLEFYSGNGAITLFYENETRLVLYIIDGS